MTKSENLIPLRIFSQRISNLFKKSMKSTSCSKRLAQMLVQRWNVSSCACCEQTFWEEEAELHTKRLTVGSSTSHSSKDDIGARKMMASTSEPTGRVRQSQRSETQGYLTAIKVWRPSSPLASIASNIVDYPFLASVPPVF